MVLEVVLVVLEVILVVLEVALVVLEVVLVVLEVLGHLSQDNWPSCLKQLSTHPCVKTTGRECPVTAA